MKLCMIGARGHSYYVLNDLAQIKDIELCAVASGDENPSSLLKCAEQWKPRGYADWHEMLDTEQPDVLSIDGPFELHAEMCTEALKRDIHVFCEKPIALTLPDLEWIRQTFAGSKATIISMTALRYEPAFYTAYQLVQTGKIGKVMLIQTRKSYKMGTRPDFYRKRVTYGGTIGWVGSHAIDWIQWFSGSKFASAMATQTRAENRGNGEMETAAQCLFTMKNGVLAQASIDFLRPAGAPTHGDDRVRVVGTEGVVEVELGKVYLTDQDGHREITELQMPERGFFAAFIGSVRGECAAPASTDETFETTLACLKAQQAADTQTIQEF